MALIDDLKDKKNTKYSSIRVKINEEFKEMIDYVIKETGVDQDEYLRLILEKSEITKVYNTLKKSKQKAEKEQQQTPESFDHNSSNEPISSH